jgi:hypothetical protein
MQGSPGRKGIHLVAAMTASLVAPIGLSHQEMLFSQCELRAGPLGEEDFTTPDFLPHPEK